jgi:hypothetical protein
MELCQNLPKLGSRGLCLAFEKMVVIAIKCKFFFHCDGIAVILSSSSKARELTLWGLGLGGKKKTSSAHVVCSCHACPSPAAKWSTAQETLEP